MSSIVISGDTSGSVTIAAPAVAGSNTLTLLAATATSSANVLATAVASTSGTSIDFTGIPSWPKRVTVIFNGVGTSGTVGYLIQIGSGSITSSGYVGGGNRLGSGSGFPGTSTAGFLINSGAVGGAKNGSIAIKLMNTTFGYVADGVMFSSS